MKIKKVLALLVAMTLLCGLTACGEGEAVQMRESAPSDKTIEGLEDVRWGVDITDGVEVTYCPSDRTRVPTAEQLEAVKAILEKRMIGKEITVYDARINVAEGEVVVRFPLAGEDMVAATIAKQLAQSANVQFRMGDGTETDAEGNPTGTLILDGTGIAKAEAVYGQVSADGDAEYYISLEMTEAATDAFAQATEQQAAVHGCISIWLDYGEGWQENGNSSRYEFISAPTVNEQITDGKAVITLGGGTYEEAKELADMINAGSLPFDISVESVDITSATLGDKTTLGSNTMTTIGSDAK